MQTRPLLESDAPALYALLKGATSHNLFHLGALRDFGLAREQAAQEAQEAHTKAWAVGAFRETSDAGASGEDGGARLMGALMALRGTGGIYHTPGDSGTLHTLAQAVAEKAEAGSLSLLSAHATQIDPLLPLIREAGVSVGPVDICRFRTLLPSDLTMPGGIEGFGPARLAVEADMERLIDFYKVGFYSLAQLPTRAAWRGRLTEQLALRTMFVVEDSEGRVASAAQTSAEGGGGAMLGGVATLQEHRGRGLSALCVGALCEHLFMREFRSVSLFYLLDNTPAERVYNKLGFRAAGEWLLAPVGLGASFAPLLGMRPR